MLNSVTIRSEADSALRWEIWLSICWDFPPVKPSFSRIAARSKVVFALGPISASLVGEGLPIDWLGNSTGTWFSGLWALWGTFPWRTAWSYYFYLRISQGDRPSGHLNLVLDLLMLLVLRLMATSRLISPMFLVSGAVLEFKFKNRIVWVTFFILFSPRTAAWTRRMRHRGWPAASCWRG